MLGRIIGRQELRGLHFDREQVANRIRIFGAVEAVEAWRRQMGDRTAIECIFHPADQRLKGGRIRPPHSCRRHHARPKSPDDFFPDFRMVPELCEVQLVQQQVGRLQPRVVAHHTILVDERTFGGDV